MSIRKQYDTVLNDFFGYNALKDEQYDIIDTILNDKKDVLAILPTGFGKSICYQLPYLISKKNVIIVSPLIALMKDQKDQLDKLGIENCVFNSDNSDKIKDKNDILKGNAKIIFITPEYLVYCESFFKSLDKNKSIACIAIDEAHCCSSWGDFRPSYSKLGLIRQWISPEIPILSLTATATQKVQQDICKILCLNNPKNIIGNFDRPNLEIIIKNKISIDRDIGPIVKANSESYVIIYCKTQKETDEVAETIKQKYHISCFSYHAGIDAEERTLVQNAFTNGEFKCIVATIAFGMGINIPNVRIVIHYGCSKNMETYYQEIGRAGRDGKPSKCYLYYSAKDFQLNRIFLEKINDPKLKLYQERQNIAIEQFVNSRFCRRKLLLQHFGQTYNKNNCNSCDNCIKNDKIVKIDCTEESTYLLSLLQSIHPRTYGPSTIISILNGLTLKPHQQMLLKSPFYNCCYKKNWKEIIAILLNKKYITNIALPNSYGGFVIDITPNGVIWLKLINENNIDDNKIYINDDYIKPKNIYEEINDEINNNSSNDDDNDNNKKPIITPKKSYKKSYKFSDEFIEF